MTNLKCECCGFEQEFEDLEAAYEAGWDAPPHFTTHVCCNLCPSVCLILDEPHTKAHALWEKEGRPAEFCLDKCMPDSGFGNPKEQKKAEAAIEEIAKIFEAARDVSKTRH